MYSGNGNGANGNGNRAREEREAREAEEAYQRALEEAKRESMEPDFDGALAYALSMVRDLVLLHSPWFPRVLWSPNLYLRCRRGAL